MGECHLDKAFEQAHQGEPLIAKTQGGPPPAVQAAEGAEAQGLANYAARWVNNNPLSGETYDPQKPQWMNLRSLQALLQGDGFNFQQGFPRTGGVSIDTISQVLTGASKGQERIVPVTDGTVRAGDIVATGSSQADINERRTCGLTATLGIVQPGGNVVKFSDGRMVNATRYWEQPNVRVFRVVP